MRLILALVFVVGCADAMNTSPPAPDLGPGHPNSDGGGSDTGTNVPMCTAAVETLSGRATYVQGSAAATDPGADSGQGGTCAQFVAGTTDSVYSDVTVAAGMVGNYQMALVTAAGSPCAYTLRFSAPIQVGVSCSVTRDYVLTVP